MIILKLTAKQFSETKKVNEHCKLDSEVCHMHQLDFKILKLCFSFGILGYLLLCNLAFWFKTSLCYLMN